MTNGPDVDDFDAFLRTSVEEAALEAEAGIDQLELGLKITDTLKHHGAVILFDDNDDVMAEKLDLYTETRIQYLRDVVWPEFEANGGSEADFDENVIGLVKFEIGEELVRQSIIIRDIAQLMSAEIVLLPSGGTLDTTAQKKLLIANFLMCGTVVRDDPWYKAINDLLLNGAFDPEGIDDMPFMLQAMQELEAQREEQPVYEEILQRLLRVLDGYASEHGEIVGYVALLTEMTVNIETQTEYTVAEAEARTDELLRRFGIFGPAAQEIQAIHREIRVLDEQ